MFETASVSPIEDDSRSLGCTIGRALANQNFELGDIAFSHQSYFGCG